MKIRIAILVLALLVGCEGTVDSTLENSPENNENNTVNNVNNVQINNANNVSTDMGTPDLNDLVCPSVECGEAAFNSVCAVCHGVDAQGVAAQWPGSIAGFDDVAPIVTNGRGDMVALPQVPADQVQSIQMYLDTLAPADETTWTGDETYFRKCAGCHGVDGEGHPTRGYQLRQPVDGYFDFITRNGADRAEYDIEMPAYPNITDTQLTEMKATLSGFPIDRSNAGLYTLYCENCHGPTGRTGSADFDVQALMVNLMVWTDHVRNGRGGQMYGDAGYMPGYDMTVFSDQEVSDMYDYFNTL